MKTAQEIFDTHHGTAFGRNSHIDRTDVMKAMQEYATQEAIESFKWMERTNIINNSGIPSHILYKMYKNQTAPK